MQARIDDQGGGTLQFAEKRVPFGFVIAHKSQFLAQGRRIQTPTIDEGRLAAEAAKLGQIGSALLKRGLIVASRNELPRRKPAMSTPGGRAPSGPAETYRTAGLPRSGIAGW